MKWNRQFPEDILAALRTAKGLRIRAGTGAHRFIGIWVVVVKDRAFVRSWSVKPDGWYRTFLNEPRGAIQVANQEISVRAVRVTDKRLRDAIDRAYLEKYSAPGAVKYAKDLGSASRERRPLSLCRCNHLLMRIQLWPTRTPAREELSHDAGNPTII